MNVYRFIAAEKTVGSALPVRFICEHLGVSPSGYYAWLTRPAGQRVTADEALTATIQEIHATSRGTYGAPRVHAERTDPKGPYQVPCGRHRVACVLFMHRRVWWGVTGAAPVAPRSPTPLPPRRRIW